MLWSRTLWVPRVVRNWIRQERGERAAYVKWLEGEHQQLELRLDALEDGLTLIINNWRADVANLTEEIDRMYAQACRDHVTDVERILREARETQPVALF